MHDTYTLAFGCLLGLIYGTYITTLPLAEQPMTKTYRTSPLAEQPMTKTYKTSPPLAEHRTTNNKCIQVSYNLPS